MAAGITWPSLERCPSSMLASCVYRSRVMANALLVLMVSSVLVLWNTVGR